MAKRESKKRIFAREQVEVDERTSGIRGSSARVDAVGSLYGRSNTSAGSANSLWSNVSPALDRLTATLQLKAREKSAEEKAELERQRIQEEKLQMMLGRTTAVETDRALDEAITRGEVAKDPQAIRQFLMEQHDLANPTHDPNFRLSFMESAIGTMQRQYGQWNDELKNEYMDTGIRTSMMALTSLFRGGAEGEVNKEEILSGLSQATENMTSFNVPIATARQKCFDAALSSIRERGLNGDSAGALALREALDEGGILGTAAPVEGRSGYEQVEIALHQALDQYKARQRRDEEDERRIRIQTQSQNFTNFFAEIGQAQDIHALNALEDRITGMPGDELAEKYGPDAGKLGRMVYNEKQFLLYDKKPDGNQEACIELDRLIFEEDARFIHEDGFLENYADKLLRDQYAKYDLQRQTMRKQKDPMLQSRVLDSLGHLERYMNPKDGGKMIRSLVPAYSNLTFFTETGELNKPVQLNHLGYALQKHIWDQLEKINPSDPKYLDNETQLLRDQVEVIRKIESEVKSGKADWLVERSNIGLREGEKSVVKDPTSFSMADLDDPTNRQIFEKHYFGSGVGAQTLQLEITKTQDPRVKEYVIGRRRAQIARQKADALYKLMEIASSRVVGMNLEGASGFQGDEGARPHAVQELAEAQRAYLLARDIAEETSSYIGKEDRTIDSIK